MGLGVLEDDHLEHIPGTALLRDVMENQTSVLRHEQGRNTGCHLGTHLSPKEYIAFHQRMGIFRSFL